MAVLTGRRETTKGRQSERIAGAQSLQRAASILRTVAQSTATGWHPRDVAGQVGLSLPTVDRMMRALCQERLLERFGPDRRYRIGPEILVLAEIRLGNQSFVEHYRPIMRRIAKQTSDTVFLWGRSGDDAVCLARVEGSYPVRVLAAEVGHRRALGLGAGTLCLLAALPDNEIRSIVARNSPQYSEVGLAARKVQGFVRHTRKSGYGLNDGHTVAEMGGVGVLVPDPIDRLPLAISVATIKSRLSLTRRMQIVEIIRAALSLSRR